MFREKRDRRQLFRGMQIGGSEEVMRRRPESAGAQLSKKLQTPWHILAKLQRFYNVRICWGELIS